MDNKVGFKETFVASGKEKDFLRRLANHHIKVVLNEVDDFVTFIYTARQIEKRKNKLRTVICDEFQQLQRTCLDLLKEEDDGNKT